MITLIKIILLMLIGVWLIFSAWLKLIIKIIKIEINIAIIPPTFLGIQRRIAYRYKKYHSG